MSSNFSPGKRQREMEQAKKKQDKAHKRAQRRDRPAGESEFVSAADVQGNMPSIEEAMRNIENPSATPRSASSIVARTLPGTAAA